jgi:hypothetical protein
VASLSTLMSRILAHFLRRVRQVSERVLVDAARVARDCARTARAAAVLFAAERDARDDADTPGGQHDLQRVTRHTANVRNVHSAFRAWFLVSH